MRPALLTWIAILFSLCIIAIIVLADRNGLPLIVNHISDIPFGDKVGHFILYGLLTLFVTLATLAAKPTRSSSRVALSTGLILAVLIGLEEFSQKHFPARTFDLLDLTASYFGVLAGGWLAWRVQR